jgi:hypothetical protein
MEERRETKTIFQPNKKERRVYKRHNKCSVKVSENQLLQQHFSNTHLVIQRHSRKDSPTTNSHIIMKVPSVSSFMWTIMAIVVAVATVGPASVEAGKDKGKSHTIIVKSGGGC